MQQRLGLGVALLGEPTLVVLDEPTSALDPVGRHDVRVIIRELRDRGATVFLNTHLLEEAEHVCDRLTILSKGRSVATGTLGELQGTRASVRVRVTGLTDRWWESLAGFGRWTAEGDWLLVEEMAGGRVPELVAAIVSLRRPGRGRHTRAPEPGGKLSRAAGGEEMSAIWTIASLTMREAVRRRLVAAFAFISVLMVGLSGWGFYRLSHGSSFTSGETNLALPQAVVLFMFMFSFVVALSASAVASLAVSSEIESGVLQAVVARPVRRSDVLLGKWLGLVGLLAAYTAIVCGLLVAVVYLTSGFVAPDPAAAAGFVLAEGVVLLTLVLLLSTRLSSLAAGVIGVALFGVAWLARVVGNLGAAFHIGAMHTAERDQPVRVADRRAVARRHVLPGAAVVPRPAARPVAVRPGRPVPRRRGTGLALPDLGGHLARPGAHTRPGQFRATRAISRW